MQDRIFLYTSKIVKPKVCILKLLAYFCTAVVKRFFISFFNSFILRLLIFYKIVFFFSSLHFRNPTLARRVFLCLLG